MSAPGEMKTWSTRVAVAGHSHYPVIKSRDGKKSARTRRHGLEKRTEQSVESGSGLLAESMRAGAWLGGRSLLMDGESSGA